MTKQEFNKLTEDIKEFIDPHTDTDLITIICTSQEDSHIACIGAISIGNMMYSDKSLKRAYADILNEHPELILNGLLNKLTEDVNETEAETNV